MSHSHRTLTQGHLSAFADISGDHNPIHVDPEYAATTAFEVPVAHGMNLFSLVLGELYRRNPGSRIKHVELMFPRPTPVGTTVEVTIEGDAAAGPLAVAVLRDDGEAGLQGSITLAPAPAPASVAAPAEHEAAVSGESYISERAFTPAEISALADLTGEVAPEGQVPVGLLAGEISKILGMDLPGQGTNYLKQQLTLLSPARKGEPLTFEVRVAKVVPDKRLVYLATTITSGDGTEVAIGRALVLAHGRLPSNPAAP